MDTQKSGIYIIKNLKNDKIYVGSSMNLNRRFIEHINKLTTNKHDNKRLQNSFNIHGNIFDFIILELCDIEILIEREQYYIDNLNPYYNICRNAGRTSGYKHTENSKENMSIAKKRLYENGFKVWNTGLSTTDEIKSKISKTLKGKFVKENHPFFGKKHTEENRQKCIDASVRRKGTHKKSQYGRLFKLNKLTLEPIAVFLSAPEAAKTLSIKGKYTTAGNKIGEAVKHNRNAYGFKWIFEKDLDQIKLDELLETLTRKTKAISIQAEDKSSEGSETTGEVNLLNNQIQRPAQLFIL